MRIDQPSFSGSITQAPSAYADLSGSFTGSFTGSLSGSFIGDITVEQAEFSNLTVKQTHWVKVCGIQYNFYLQI